MAGFQMPTAVLADLEAPDCACAGRGHTERRRPEVDLGVARLEGGEGNAPRDEDARRHQHGADPLDNATNGILSVEAKDTATGKEQQITITASSSLSEDEIQKMVQDAAEHEADDKVRRAEIERRNKLDNFCFTMQRTLAESRDKLQSADIASLESLVKAGWRASCTKAPQRDGPACVRITLVCRLHRRRFSIPARSSSERSRSASSSW